MEQNDHDLLVELSTEFRAVRADIKELKETTIARITAMEAELVVQAQEEVLMGLMQQQIQVVVEVEPPMTQNMVVMAAQASSSFATQPQTLVHAQEARSPRTVRTPYTRLQAAGR